MHRILRGVGMGLLFSLGFAVAAMQAQQPVAAEPQASSQTVQAPRELVPTLPVPRLMKFAGTLKDEQGKLRTGAVGVTFAIYKDQEGGAALWLETQNAELDEQGRYTVLLGATKNEGLPLELFASGEPRWLGVQVNLPREVEQARVLLVSVPYALKASDADTVGGLPASAFVQTQPAAGSSGGAGTSKTGTRSAPSPAATISGSGTLNQVTKFTPDGVTIGNSAITEVNGNVGIGYTTPVTKLVVGVPTGGAVLNASNLADQDMFVTVTAPGASDKFAYFGPSTATNLALGTGLVEKMRITNAGNVGIGVSNPNARLMIAVPPGALGMNMSNLADQDMFVTVSSPGATDKVGFIGPGTATNLALGTGLVEKMRITNAGNVGIGTTTPNATLDVSGKLHVETGNNMFRVDGPPPGGGSTLASFGGSGDFDIDAPSVAGGRFVVQDSTGNVGIGTASPNDKLDVNGIIHTSGGTYFDNDVQGAYLSWNQLTGGTGETDFVNKQGTGPGGFAFINVDTIGSPLMFITGGGNVGIGTSAPDSKLSVNGSADRTGSTFWGIFSDGRLKDLHGSFDFGLRQVLQLHPVRYQYKEENALGIRDREEHVGLVAQEVQRVIPEAVSTNAKGYLMLHSDPILWSMLNAIKEQQRQIRVLRKQVQAETAELAKLKARLEKQ